MKFTCPNCGKHRLEKATDCIRCAECGEYVGEIGETAAELIGVTDVRYTVHFVEHGVEFDSGPQTERVCDEVITRLQQKGVPGAFKRAEEIPDDG